MSETAESPQPSEIEQIQALLARMDALLAQGADSVRKVDEFYRQHDLAPGIGEKVLLSDAVSPRDREIFRRLFAEYEHMEERLRSFEESSLESAPRAVGVRAVGNRYRI